MVKSFAKRLFGIITVEQRGNDIIVEGVDAYKLAHDIQKEWKTSRLTGAIIPNAGRSRFTVAAFFLPEVLYIVDTLLSSTGGYRRMSSRRSLIDLKKALKENTWWAEVQARVTENAKPRLDRSKLSLFIHTPMDYNLRYFDEYEFQTGTMNKRGNILAGAPGSGKTYMSLAVAEMVHSDYIFVCAPNITMEDPWRNAVEARDLYKRPQSYWMAKDGDDYNGERFVIFNYEALDKALAIAKKIGNKRTVTVILDESHHMNELTSGRTNKFIELCSILESKDVIWASGTPIKKMGYEVIPFLTTTDPMFGPREQEQFKKAFGREGTRGADILQSRMEKVMTVVEKSEFKKEKPNIEYVKVKLSNGKDFTLDVIRKNMREFIEERFKYYAGIKDIYERDYLEGVRTYESVVGKAIPANEFAEYKRTVRILRAASDYRTLGKEMQLTNAFEKKHIIPALPKDMAKRFIDAKSAFKYLPLKIQGECLGRVVGKAREACSTAMGMEADLSILINGSNSKSVIFTSYIRAVEATAARLKKDGHNPTVLYGKNSSDIRSVLSVFSKDAHVNPLTTTFKSLSTGVPLLAASTEILLDPPFRPYILDQTISRVDRLGQEHPVNIYILQLDTGDQPNISTRTKDILSWAQEQVEAITGVKSAYSTEEKDDASLEDWTEWEWNDSMEAWSSSPEYHEFNKAQDHGSHPSLLL